MKGYLVLAAGVLMQLILGSIYSWSEIAANLTAQWNLVSWQTQMIYGVNIALFSFGTIVTGPLVKRWGPRRMTLISALLFTLGFFGAAASGGSYPGLLATAGMGVGLAMAFGYVVPLSTATAWFPRKKGTVTGLAVMGFGGGAILASRIIRLLTQQGWGIGGVLLAMGLAGGGILTLAALFQGFPPRAERCPASASGTTPLTIGEAFKRKSFWGLWFSMLLSTMGGLIIIGSAVSLAQERDLPQLAPLAVSVLALGNALGRLLWGRLLDILGHKAIPTSLSLMTLGFALILWGGSHPPLFMAGILLTGLQFGSALVIYAAFTDEFFGEGAIARIYPYIFAAYGMAALLGPPLGGFIYDIRASYQPVLTMALIFPLAGLIVSFIMKHFNPEKLH